MGSPLVPPGETGRRCPHCTASSPASCRSRTGTKATAATPSRSSCTAFPTTFSPTTDVVPPLAGAGCGSWCRTSAGYGPTRSRWRTRPDRVSRPRWRADLVALLDALGHRARRAGRLRLGRPRRVHGRRAVARARARPRHLSAATTSSTAPALRPAPPEAEHRLWYQYYFHGERGRRGLASTGASSAAAVATVVTDVGVHGRAVRAHARRRSTTPTSSTSSSTPTATASSWCRATPVCGHRGSPCGDPGDHRAHHRLRRRRGRRAAGRMPRARLPASRDPSLAAWSTASATTSRRRPRPPLRGPRRPRRRRLTRLARAARWDQTGRVRCRGLSGGCDRDGRR